MQGLFRKATRLRRLRDVFADYVAFEVHNVSDLLQAKRSLLRGSRNEVYGEPVVAEPRNRELYAVNRDQAFHDRLRGEDAAAPDAKLEIAAFRRLRGNCAAAVDVSLDEKSVGSGPGADFIFGAILPLFAQISAGRPARPRRPAASPPPALPARPTH